ncbi:MAG: hypothetical protein WD990_07695 [Acidimicrobiia bacterium]
MATDVSFRTPQCARLSSIVHNALRDDLFRFDAPDLMPREIGTGAFWDGMVNLFEEDGADIEGVLGGIEQAWKGLEQG